MNVRTTNLINGFVGMLTELAATTSTQFSGAGFVLYNDLSSLSQYHCNLVNDGQLIPPLKLGKQSFMNYLVEISKYQHPYHDGFHFINSDGVLTHVAQFFSPPVNKSLPKIIGQGARTFCSQCGSNVNGVLMIGSVSTNRSIYLFEKGNLVDNDFLYEAA